MQTVAIVSCIIQISNRVFVKAPGPRHKLIESGDGITLMIPSKRNPFLFAFLTFWLCGWAFGEFVAPMMFLVSLKKDPGASLFIILWLSVWTIGGGVALYTWLWIFRGQEIITVTPAVLGLKRNLFGYGRVKQYDATEVRNLRVAPIIFNPFDRGASFAFWGIGGGLLAFDYGCKTFRFGAGIDEAEARYIFQLVAVRFPKLAEERGQAPQK